ncbi:MAG: putative porin [Bacteroidota bacterium]
MGRTLFIGFILMASAVCLFGQSRNFPGQAGGFSGGFDGQDTLVRGQDEFIETLDTFGIFYFYPDNPNLEYSFDDSLLNNYFQQYDPARKRDHDYMHLGIVGSAHHPMFYEPTQRQGFEVGWDQFDLYLTPANRMPFYRIEKAYTNLSYTQGSEQPDALFSAQFSRNFANGVNFAFDYKRISQLGEQFQYPNQNTRTTALTSGLSYESPNGRYKGYFTYAANTIQHKDNGGILVEPTEDGDFSSPQAAEVFLRTAETRHAHREWSYHQYYRFGGERDSLQGFKRAYTLHHEFNYNNSKYNFWIENPPLLDTAFFSRFPHLDLDDRGTRVFVEHRAYRNSFKITTFRQRSLNENRVKQQRDLIEVGLVHTLHRLNQEPVDSTLNNLFLTGKFNFSPNDRLRIETEGHFGLWDNAGDYRASGTFFFDFKKFGSLKAQVINQLYKPTLIEHRYYLTQRQLWDNDFDRTLETNLQVTYSLPSINMEVMGGYHLINNFIYFDTLGFSRQLGVPVSVLQLSLKQDFKLGPMHLDNVVTVQEISENELRLPAFFSKHSLYYAGKWFKVLNVQLGFDLRLNGTYNAMYYNPAIGQFHLQEDRAVEFYPALDTYLSLQVNKFRAFFKWENLTDAFIGDRLYYQTAYYGFPGGGLRIGIRWRFIN